VIGCDRLFVDNGWGVKEEELINNNYFKEMRFDW
jgi:hypothetical protein